MVDKQEIKVFQENLALLRRVAGWSAENLSALLGVTRQTIMKMEKEDESERSSMSVSQYIALRTLFAARIRTSDNWRLACLIYLLMDSHPGSEDVEKLLEEIRQEISSVPNRAGSAFLADRIDLILKDRLRIFIEAEEANDPTLFQIMVSAAVAAAQNAVLKGIDHGPSHASKRLRNVIAEWNRLFITEPLAMLRSQQYDIFELISNIPMIVMVEMPFIIFQSLTELWRRDKDPYSEEVKVSIQQQMEQSTSLYRLITESVETLPSQEDGGFDLSKYAVLLVEKAIQVVNKRMSSIKGDDSQYDLTAHITTCQEEWRDAVPYVVEELEGAKENIINAAVASVFLSKADKFDASLL